MFETSSVAPPEMEMACTAISICGHPLNSQCTASNIAIGMVPWDGNTPPRGTSMKSNAGIISLSERSALQNFPGRFRP